MPKENCRRSAVGTRAWKRAFARGRPGKCFGGGACELFLKKAQKLKREANEPEGGNTVNKKAKRLETMGLFHVTF